MDHERIPTDPRYDGTEVARNYTVRRRIVGARHQRREIQNDVEGGNALKNMAAPERERRFVQSLRDWGHIFMLTVWLQSIMASAIAMKDVESTTVGSITTPDDKYFERRNSLMKKEMSFVWERFKREFLEQTTEDVELAAEMIILIRNQLAHCHISSGREFALFLPKQSSQGLLNKLKRAGWIEEPAQGISNPEMLVLREGDRKWFDTNAAMILKFTENTILRATQSYGISDALIC